MSGEARRSAKSAVVAAFRRHCSPALKAQGFVGSRGHFVRRQGAVTQVIELQHSIYGGRITANLGLDLEWLRPLVRWIPQPALGPHAHDATRWVRIGIVSPAKADVWWSYADETESVDDACRNLARAILEYGVRWMESESAREAFLQYAQEKLVRSQSPVRPHGSFLELRLMAAVCAWRGEFASAHEHAAHAAQLWTEERERLVNARKIYKKRHPSDVRLVGVPNLVRELERIISPTTGARAFSPPARKKRRSKSSRQ